jgi:hypothetical protein
MNIWFVSPKPSQKVFFEKGFNTQTPQLFTKQSVARILMFEPKRQRSLPNTLTVLKVLKAS